MARSLLELESPEISLTSVSGWGDQQMGTGTAVLLGHLCGLSMWSIQQRLFRVAALLTQWLWVRQAEANSL
jgi:hypothetical protein